MTEERKAYVRHYLNHTDLKLAPLILEYITELETQINKMKCCGNCKFRQKDTLNKRCFECKDVKNGEIRLFHWGFAE